MDIYVKEKKMLRLPLSKRIERRAKDICKLIVIIVFLVVMSGLYIKINTKVKISIKQIVLDLCTMIISALISTVLAIYMTKNDILESDYADKKEKYGIVTFETGYNNIFNNNESKAYLNVNDWKQFFNASNDKIITIVAVHANGFFEDEEIRSYLLKLCAENEYQVNVILANPYSDEVIHEAIAERKVSENHIRDKIFDTYSLFQKDIAELDKKLRNDQLKNLHEGFRIVFSKTLPKGLIFRTGEYMIVSPYSFESPERAPTIILEKTRTVAFFENYEKYIKRLLQKSQNFDQLRKHISAEQFFDQPYRTCSEEFKEDFKNCNSLRILGLGQRHMIAQYKANIINMLKRGGELTAILGDPDGASLKMCVDRSLVHDDYEGAYDEHVNTINELLKLKSSVRTKKNYKVNVYKWDCFFPYTMYIFNYSADEKNVSAKIYIWMTNLFEKAELRPGFVIDQINDRELFDRYIEQYNATLNAASEITEFVEKKYQKFADRDV